MLKVLMWAEEESFRAGSVLYNFKKRQCKKKAVQKKAVQERQCWVCVR